MGSGSKSESKGLWKEKKTMETEGPAGPEPSADLEHVDNLFFA